MLTDCVHDVVMMALEDGGDTNVPHSAIHLPLSNVDRNEDWDIAWISIEQYAEFEVKERDAKVVLVDSKTGTELGEAYEAFATSGIRFEKVVDGGVRSVRNIHKQLPEKLSKA